MDLLAILKLLALEDISATVKYDREKDLFYVDLKTEAKSHLYLYENMMLKGRYGYEEELDKELDNEQLLRQLCFIFKICLHGRDFWNPKWAQLCKKLNVW